MTEFADILAVAQRPATSVPLCLRGDLVAEFRALERDLEQADRRAPSLAEASPAAVIAARMNALREQMLAATVAFRLEAMPPAAWSDFLATQPAKSKDIDEDAFKAAWYAWVCQLVAHTCTDPVMTAEQVDQLVPRLSGEQWARLSDTAWSINASEVNVPFSVAASVLLPEANSAQK
ncbi:hypothetical protein Lfu02_79780 [Longispora fulva]|uniref:Uncharacterized protein n=1 Tax=Longispora fulva TaxID=619741 RepID=A0A8J7KN19_9ACTN|nr:hypothetical protein [Longispora fulva]MBG6141139.1 hypothetical protein [Longispora fulva]GIG63606.1 hypothetical protein Lfu02_79780 [Longispora fulva]